MWKLVIEDDEGKRTIVPLTRDDYTIGRKEGNTIRLTERNVSREHARIAKKATPTQMVVDGQTHTTMYALEDITSYNGVYVNGLRVAAAQDLVNGDLVQIGDYRMVLQDDQAAAQPIAPAVDITDAKTTIPTGAMNRGSLLMERPNRFVMLAGPTPGAEFPLDRDRMTIGRAEEASISVNHNSVSRLHCEIHDLGEGRFEIVDKGSSNGVRVNSADLKRGIVEAGDVIELGDVKFKFVGAGQIFLPGINDTAQLAAIADRVVSPRSASTRSTLLPYVVLGALLAAIVLFLVMWHKQAQNTTPGTGNGVGATDDHDSQVLTDAKRLCDNSECEKAHEMLATGLADTSVQRTSPDFKEIERRWAEVVLTHAAAEPDIQAKRVLLQKVAGATTVEPELRKAAADQLQILDQAVANSALANAKNDSGAGGVPSGSAATPQGSTTGVVPSSPAGQPAGSVTGASPTTASPNGQTFGQGGGVIPPGQTTTAPPVAAGHPALSALDQARNIMLDDPDKAKALLMPRLASGKATPDELHTLKTICLDPRISDANCVAECKHYLAR